MRRNNITFYTNQFDINCNFSCYYVSFDSHRFRTTEKKRDETNKKLHNSMNINSPSTAVCRVFQWNWKMNRIVDSLVSCAWDLQQIMRSIIEIVFTFLARECIDEKIYIDIFQNNGERSLLEWKGMERELLCKSRLRRQRKVLEQLTAAVDENENQFHGCLTTNRTHHGIIITCKKK